VTTLFLVSTPPYTEDASASQVARENVMDDMGDRTTKTTRRPRADAVRNHERVLDAAKAVFSVGGPDASLEAVARRAGVGIGTLYRHFPNRQALLEALYVNEVDEICRSAGSLDAADPWQALNDWFESLIGYLATKRALAHELTNYLDADAPLFKECRAGLFAAGEPLLKRAQDAGVVRPDVDFSDVLHMLGGITKMPASQPGQVEHVLRIALDGLRYHPQT
jgi:AcrR family transcriptional regulator